MSTRFPLYSKILFWFFLNLLVLGVTLYAFFSAQFRVGPEWLLGGGTGERLQAVAQVLTEDLNVRPRSEWDEILRRFSRAHRVEFLVFRNNGEQLAGEETRLPSPVQQRLMMPGNLRREFGPPGGGDDESFPARRRGPPPIRDGAEFRGPPRGPPDRQTPGRPPFMVRTENPRRYWIGLRMPIRDPALDRQPPAILIVMAKSLRDGLLIDSTVWMWVGAGAFVFSILFWLPFVRGITRSLGQMTHATAHIAEGKFDVRVNETRRDEIGSLGGAINRMAARLGGFVTGQKRFLGDIAHELCSPIARMQMAVGILEEHAGEKDKKYVEDLHEEVQHMSSLVNELLSFSKASLGASNIKLQPVSLRTVVDKVVRREVTDGSDIRMDVAKDLEAITDPELLIRAISNLLRNAIRHAGQTPITISARAIDHDVEVVVADNGPGVPESEIPRLFDPFYRVDTSRNRETGGIGLGLSIVKMCVETCRGTVTCRNRQPSGLEVTIRLPSNENAPSV